MQATADPVEPVDCVRRLMEAARRKSLDVSANLHPAWKQGCWHRIGVDAVTAARSPQRWSDTLAAFYKLQWPPIDRFQVRAHRIAVLPRAELLRVLAAIALHGERGRVRLSIGPGLRAAVIERVGEVAYVRMLEAPLPLQGAQGGLTAAELEPERLAAVGLARLVECGEWRSSSLLSWMRVAIAPLDETLLPGVKRVEAESREALSRLPSYFPEHAWLFGSPMDRALSDSTTA